MKAIRKKRELNFSHSQLFIRVPKAQQISWQARESLNLTRNFVVVVATTHKEHGEICEKED
jgi:hypothetical protein